MKLATAFFIGTALIAGAAVAQTPSVPSGSPSSPNVSPPGTELPAPNTGVVPPNAKKDGSVGTRPIGPPASQTEGNPNNPGADLKKLDKAGRGGQQQ